MVEPLSQPCMMVPDMNGGRELQLAHLLYALRRALDRLKTYVLILKVGVFYLIGIPYRRIESQSQDTISPKQYPQSIPRIYEAFMIENGTKEMLTFQSQLLQHHAKAMLFLATSQGSKFLIRNSSNSPLPAMGRMCTVSLRQRDLRRTSMGAKSLSERRPLT
jgi:hypothetical protein